MAGDALALETQYRTTKTLLEASRAESQCKSQEIKRLEAIIAARDLTIQQAEHKAQEDEIIRLVRHRSTSCTCQGHARVMPEWLVDAIIRYN